MSVRVLINEKNTIELELGDVDQSLAQLLAEKLTAESDVEFAAFKVEHPLIGKPTLYVKTKKGDASKIVAEKLEEIKKEVTEFKSKFAEIVK